MADPTNRKQSDVPTTSSNQITIGRNVLASGSVVIGAGAVATNAFALAVSVCARGHRQLTQLRYCVECLSAAFPSREMFLCGSCSNLIDPWHPRDGHAPGCLYPLADAGREAEAVLVGDPIQKGSE